MAKTFINGGDVDKIQVTVGDSGKSDIRFRVTGDTKGKEADVELEIKVIHTDGNSEVIIKKFGITKKKNKCTGFCEFSVPYEVSNVKILRGSVTRTL